MSQRTIATEVLTGGAGDGEPGVVAAAERLRHELRLDALALSLDGLTSEHRRPLAATIAETAHQVTADDLLRLRLDHLVDLGALLAATRRGHHQTGGPTA